MSALRLRGGTVVGSSTSIFNYGLSGPHGKEPLKALFPCVQRVPWFSEFRAEKVSALEVVTLCPFKAESAAGLLLCCHDQELFSEEAPGDRELQVQAEKQHRILPTVYHSVGQEPIEAALDRKPAIRQAFAQA